MSAAWQRLLGVSVLVALTLIASRTPDAQALATTPAIKRDPSRVLIVAREFSYALSRQRVRSGRVILQLLNAGEDVHNLRLRRRGAARSRSLPRIDPGERFRLNRALKPGRYYLWCSVADHRARGMRASLRVSRR